ALFRVSQKLFLHEVLPVLNKPPEQRSEQEVLTSRELLKQMRERLTTDASGRERTIPSQPAKYKDYCVALQDLLRQQALYYRLAEQRLDKGTRWDASDDKAFSEHKQALTSASKKWEELFK